MHRPLRYLTLLFILGIAAGKWTHLPPQTAQYLLAFTAILTLCSLLSGSRLFPYLVLALFLPLGLLHGSAITLHTANETLSILSDGDRRIVEGVVVSRDDRGGSKRFIVAAERLIYNEISAKAGGRILLTIASGADPVVPGDRIRFWGRLKRPKNFENPGGFDYEGYLRNRGIHVTSFLKDDRTLAIMGGGSKLWRAIYSFRKTIMDAIEGSAAERSKGVMAALSLGNRGYMDDKDVKSFRRSGAAHMLAISGLHMGIAAFFFYRIFRWLLSRSERILLCNLAGKGAAILTLAPLTLYLMVSGMATSAVRAYIMVLVFLLSVILERDKDIYSTISLAAIIILAAWPYALFEASFQLSFAAVIAIVYMVPRMEAYLPDRPVEANRRFSRKVILFIFVSFAASTGTAPIVAHHFMEVSTAGIITNLLIIPALGFIAVPLLSMAMFFAVLLPPLAGILFAAGSHIASVSVSIVELISSLPFTSVSIKPPRAYEIAIFYLFLWVIFNTGKRWAVPIAVIIPFFFLSSKALDILQERADRNLEITFLSVGQGESTFIRFPGGKTMLIDGGGFYDNSFDIGEMVVRPYLLSRGVKRIDCLVLTHPHPDHLNGLLHIAEEFDVGEVWTNTEPVADLNHRRFRGIIRERRIRELGMLDESPDLAIEGVTVQFLHPPGLFFDRGSDSDSRINNRSLVMRLAYGRRSFLLTGDLESEGEMKILEAGYRIGADVIKVPHHGSMTSSSSEFIDRVSPAYAVFTVGHMNRFGFPVDEVVRRYTGAGSMLLRTDLHGAITFSTDGEDLEFKTFRNP